MAVEYTGYVGWVRPESQVHLMTGVPLDNTYSKTIYQLSLDDQREWFEPYIVHEWDDLSYIRVNSNTIRVNINAEEIQTCNYLMFQNTAFSQNVHDNETWYKHWFYCFVSEINYINNNCTEIVFEIDVMQTWFFEYEIGQCYIIREHTATDEIGEHLIEDIAPVGDYLCDNYEELLWNNEEYGYSNARLPNLSVIVQVCDTTKGSRGNVYDGIYGGSELFVFDSGDVNGINEKLNEYTQAPDSITGMYMVPSVLTRGVTSGSSLPQSGMATSLEASAEPIKKGDTINGYEPRCAKLYSYPYCFYGVDNASGSSSVYPYEYFDELTPNFTIIGPITNPVSVVLTPRHFKGQIICYNEGLTLTSYPACSWNADYYTTWAAQNSVPIQANWENTTNQIAINTGENAVNSALSIVGGVASANPATIANGASSLIYGGAQNAQDYAVAKTEIENQVYAASISADIAKGGLSNGCANSAANRQGFFGGRYALLPEVLRSIDDYFWAYGYKVNRLDYPTVAKRHYWNFIQTSGCNLYHTHRTGETHGGLPVDAEAKICSIYDNGITFWMPYDDVTVGDYSQPNGLWGRGAG